MISSGSDSALDRHLPPVRKWQVDSLAGIQPDLVEKQLHAVRNAVQQLLLSGHITAEEAARQMAGVERCLKKWRREGREPLWIANQLAAVDEDLARVLHT